MSLLQPSIRPIDLGYDSIGQQISPSSGRSQPSRYQNSHGRWQAVAPYHQTTNQGSLERIQRGRPTSTYPGMACTGDNDFGAGEEWQPQPVIEESKQTSCLIQFGTDHAGPWTSITETRTDSVHADYYEVSYIDPERCQYPSFIDLCINYTLFRSCPWTSTYCPRIDTNAERTYNFLIVWELSHICVSSCSFNTLGHDSIDKPWSASTYV